jgi:hypothetical protein
MSSPSASAPMKKTDAFSTDAAMIANTVKRTIARTTFLNVNEL